VRQLIAIDERLAALPGLEPSSVRAPDPSAAPSGGVEPALKLFPQVGAGRGGRLRSVWVPASAAAAAVLAVWTAIWFAGNPSEQTTPAHVPASTRGASAAPAEAVAAADAGPVVIGPAYIDAIVFGSEDELGELPTGDLGIGGEQLADLPERDRRRVLAELARRSPERYEIVRHYLESIAQQTGRPSLMPPEAPPAAAGPPAVPLELRIVRLDEARRR
jgi:hypothetical protein